MKLGISSSSRLLYLKAIYFILLLISFSCQKKDIKDGNKITTFDKNNLLEEAYNDRDSVKLCNFFNEWHKYSKEINVKPKNEIELAIYEIFNAVYHPFNLEKYGWSPRPHYKKYKFAILPTDIKFAVVDSLAQLDDIKLDTLKKFYPKPELDRAKIIHDSEPFKTIMIKFLEEDSYKKKKFLEKIINTPNSPHWKEYKTSPKFIGVFLNNSLDISIVNLILVSTELRIKLNKIKDNWIILNVEKLMIE